MCLVTFLPYNKTFKANKGETVLFVALKNQIDLRHNCGGIPACSTCHVIIKEGANNLSDQEDVEADQLDLVEGLTLNSRLGCQAKVYGDVTIEILSI